MKTEEHSDSRKFQVYNLGLAKTGTTSITKIFDHYQAGHEFLLPETGQAIKDFQNTTITQEELREFVKKRDAIGNLEIDSTFCNSYYVDILAKEFPSAQFIFTIRDCYSWVDSVLNMVATHKQITHLDLIFGLPNSLLQNAEGLRQHFPEYIDRLLELWSALNTEVLAKLPSDRSLIIRTHEISAKIDDLARFVEVPAETLAQDKSHEFKAAQKLNLLQEVDLQELEAKVHDYCSPLMQEFFPGYTLKDFLQGNPIPK
jgi:hypothetical protein